MKTQQIHFRMKEKEQASWQAKSMHLMLQILCIFRSIIISILHICEVQRQKKTLLVKNSTLGEKQRKTQAGCVRPK